MTNPSRQERPHQAWISPETWRLIYTMIPELWSRDSEQQHIRAISQQIKASLQDDRQRRSAEAGYADESLLASEPPLIREAWIRMKGWYKDAITPYHPPTRVTIKRTEAERVDLYQNTPIGVTPFHIKESVPDNEDTAWTVHRLCLNRSRGPSIMQKEHLCKWLRETTQEEEPYATHWKKVVSIFQTTFRDVTLADDSMCQTMVIILKGDGIDFQGIGLVEVLWKTATGLLNRRFPSAIRFHEFLHGFWTGHVMGTTDLEAKLLQHLTDIREAVLYDIFLNLNKVYADLD